MENKNKTGFIIINKSGGPTSHSVINQLRRITGIRKIGHAGTLDPFATGVLLCAIGRESTKLLGQMIKQDKEYRAEIFLGAVSDTYDRTGNIKNIFEVGRGVMPGLLEIEKTLLKFVGKQKQVPPMFSAVKIGGKKLYELARQGIEVERGFSEIEIYQINLIKYKWPFLEIIVNCSSGTYIRSLAYDLGQELGCGAYLNNLTRTAVGDFKITDAVNLEELTPDNWHKFLIK